MIERFDQSQLIDRNNGVLDVVEDGLQMRGGLLANLPGQRLRFVGHQLHGAHHATAFQIQAVVMIADGPQQPADVRFTAATACLGDLAFEEVV